MPVSDVVFCTCRIQLLELCACKFQRLKQLNLTFLITVDHNFKFDHFGRIVHAKYDTVSDVFCMCQIHFGLDVVLNTSRRAIDI